MYAVTWEYDFEDLNQGDLVGQSLWSDYGPSAGVTAVSPIVGYSADSSVRGVVLLQPVFDGEYVSRGKMKISPICRTGDRISLEFDARITDQRGVATFGFGTISEYPASGGIFFNRFALREQTYGGELHYAMDTKGNFVSPQLGDWYRIRSQWKKDAGSGEWSGTLEVRNLSKNERFYTKLYFDLKQSVERVSLGYDSELNEAEFDIVTVRTSQPGDEIDNLLIDASR
jgi:hypothetical protein